MRNLFFLALHHCNDNLFSHFFHCKDNLCDTFFGRDIVWKYLSMWGMICNLGMLVMAVTCIYKYIERLRTCVQRWWTKKGCFVLCLSFSHSHRTFQKTKMRRITIATQTYSNTNKITVVGWFKAEITQCYYTKNCTSRTIYLDNFKLTRSKTTTSICLVRMSVRIIIVSYTSRILTLTFVILLTP